MSSFHFDSISPVDFNSADKLPLPTGGQDIEGAQAKQEAASVSKSEGDFAAVVRLLTEAMDAGPVTASLLAARAEALLKLERPSAAVYDCNAALTMNPDSAKALRFRGYANALTGNWIDANRDLASAQRIDYSDDVEVARRIIAEKAAAIERELTAQRVAHEEEQQRKRAKEEEEARERRARDTERLRRERALGDLGSHLITKSGKRSTLDAISTTRLIGFYFSAHWCPPCRQFTPMLSEMYNSIREEESDLTRRPEHVLEIIFVSSDRDARSFQEYYQSMPWMSIPFEDKNISAALSQKFDVNGIPALFIINAADGSVVDNDGRSTVMNARGNVQKLLKSWRIL